MHTFSLGPIRVGADAPVCIVAEIGINFDGKLAQAKELIDLAADAGCSAAKFQLFTAERMYPPGAGTYTTAAGRTRDIVEVVREGELPHAWIPELRAYAHARGLAWFSTVCDEVSGDVLERCDTDAFKFASYELTHLPLFRHVARKGKPIIFSSGGGTIQEVADVIDLVRNEGCQDLALMHCIGQYPADPNQIHLGIIRTLQLAFPDVVIGYSDHTVDPVAAPVAAVALGAKFIEKHITIDRNLPGPDHSFAVDPPALRRMVTAIRETEARMRNGERIAVSPALLGSSARQTYPNEQYWRDFAFRCVFAKKSIRAGEAFTEENIAVLRPGNIPRGLLPRYYDLLRNGYCATRDIPAHTSVTWDVVLDRAPAHARVAV